jgi:hypothetical protein
MPPSALKLGYRTLTSGGISGQNSLSSSVPRPKRRGGTVGKLCTTPVSDSLVDKAEGRWLGSCSRTIAWEAFRGSSSATGDRRAGGGHEHSEVCMGTKAEVFRLLDARIRHHDTAAACCPFAVWISRRQGDEGRTGKRNERS